MGRGQELLDAARNGDKRTVEKILGQITKRSGPFTSLRRGAGVNVHDDNGYTPLHHACLNGHKEIVRLLLSVDASPCAADKKGATPLHLAAWKGDSSVVAMLLAHKNPPVNIDQLTSDHETALLIAAHFGYADVVAQLMAKGADVSVRNIKEESALDLAAQYGRLETVQHLICVMPQLLDMYKMPRSRGRVFSSTPLHRASKNGRKEVVSLLLSAGCDPNIRTFNGTPLHEAACFGKASVVRILLANGADLYAKDRRGKTVYDLLADYSEEATRRVRRVIREYETQSRVGYDSEDDLPPFPVQDCSPTGYPPAGIVFDKPKRLFLAACSKTDALSPNNNLSDFVNNILLNHATLPEEYEILSPSLKNVTLSSQQNNNVGRFVELSHSSVADNSNSQPTCNKIDHKIDRSSCSHNKTLLCSKLLNDIKIADSESELENHHPPTIIETDLAHTTKFRPKSLSKPLKSKAEKSPNEATYEGNNFEVDIGISINYIQTKVNGTYTPMRGCKVLMADSSGNVSNHHKQMLCSSGNMKLDVNESTSMDDNAQIQIRSDLSKPALTHQLSVHNKGDKCCVYDALDYSYVYELNPKATCSNVSPFIKRKENISSNLCICPGHDGVKPKINKIKNKKILECGTERCDSYVDFFKNNVHASQIDSKTLVKTGNTNYNAENESHSRDQSINNSHDQPSDNVVFQPFVKRDQSELDALKDKPVFRLFMNDST